MKKKMNIDFDLSKRNFLAYSSLSTLAAVSCAFIPKPVYSAIVNECKINTSHSGLTLVDLDSINFYTRKTNALRCVGIAQTITFDEAVDEVQFISNVMFNEMVKSVFQRDFPSIAEQIGGDILPNEKVLGMSDSITDVHSLVMKHYDYISEIMPEFIAQLIQGNYQAPQVFNELSREERKSLNSWDMTSINLSINREKESSAFKLVMDDLYCLATSFATSSQGDKLHRYKLNKPDEWGEKLYEWYCEEGKIEACIDGMDICKGGDEYHYQNANSLITTLRTLNQTCLNRGLKTLTEAQIQRFDETIYGAICLATSLSVKWGYKKDAYSTVNNLDNMHETLNMLRTNSNSEIQGFWESFFNKYNQNDFINTLQEVNWADCSVYSEKSLKILQSKFPEFIDPIKGEQFSYVKERKRFRTGTEIKKSEELLLLEEDARNSKLLMRRRFRSKGKSIIGNVVKWKQNRMTKRIVKMSGQPSILAPSAIANIFLFLTSSTHYVWATTASNEEQINFSYKLGLGTTMFGAVESIGYYAGVKAISNYMKRMTPTGLKNATIRFSAFSDFWLGVKNTKKLINRPIVNIAHSLFNTSIIAKLTTKVTFFLSVVGLYYAVDALKTATLDGNTADIIFEALNTTITAISFILGFAVFQGMAFAGPLGIALMVIGGVLIIAKLIYGVLKPRPEILPPIADFTEKLLVPRGCIYKDTGYYLSVVKDSSGFSYVKRMSLKTLDFIGENNADLELRYGVSYPNSIVASKDKVGRIYSFERSVNDNYKYASFGELQYINTKGFKNTIDWSKADSKIIRVISAVENMTMYNEVYALFLCDIKLDRKIKRALYLTRGLEFAPRSNDRIIKGIDEKDSIQDIMVVDNKRYPVLIAVSDRSLYQISQWYKASVIDSDIFTHSNRATIEKVELLSGGGLVNLLVRYCEGKVTTPQSNNKLCRGQLYSLAPDVAASGEYKKIIKGASFQIGKEDQVICREYFSQKKKRLDFLVIGRSEYKRMGGILNDEGNAVIGFNEGLSLPSSGAIAKALVLKNSFISF